MKKLRAEFAFFLFFAFLASNLIFGFIPWHRTTGKSHIITVIAIFSGLTITFIVSVRSVARFYKRQKGKHKINHVAPPKEK